MNTLNIKTCRPAGVQHPPAIYIVQHNIRFNKGAEKLLNLQEGDKISFQLKDGILRLLFDPKTGFEIKTKSQGKYGYNYTIYNTSLAVNLLRISGKKLAIGEFSGGGYILNKY